MINGVAFRNAVTLLSTNNSFCPCVASIRESAHRATTKVERERTFAMLHENELVLGSIDRLVLLMQHGRPIAADIIDFKTDRFAGDRNRWIEARRLHYGPQLEEYRFAVSQCFGVPLEHIGTRLLLIEADAVIAIFSSQ